MQTAVYVFDYETIPDIIFLIIINPSSAKLNNLNFHPLEVVCRYRDPQLQVGENYWYLFSLRPNIYKSWCLNTHLIPNTCNLINL